MMLSKGILSIFAMAVSLAACAVQPEPTNAPVPLTYFGMHIHRAVQTQPWLPNGDKLTPWPSVKFGSWRLWDAYVAWPSLEPEKGKWNFSTLDKYVAMAKLTGVQLLLPLGLTPAWASARPDEPSGYRPGNAAEPHDIQDWRNYVRTVATRYKGRIRFYELWNEVNYKHFYSGSPEKLIELARIAYETIKEVDPDAIVVSPSVTGGGRHLKWLDDYLAKGGGQYADVISYHFYVPKDPPEAMLPLIRQVQDIMRKHGQAHKPLWNTETGWQLENHPETPRVGAAGADWLKLDNERASAYLARALILGWSAGVTRYYWYAWDNMDMGLIEPGELTMKPAALSYDSAVRWLLGAKVGACESTDNRWFCPLQRKSGDRAWIAWTDSNARMEWSVPVAWNIKDIERLDGSAYPWVAGNKVILSGIPIMLIAKP